MSLDLAAEVKKKLSLSSVIKKTVELRGSGARFLALCPFHQEKTPSFQIRDDVGRFKCFGCGASGDVFEFLMRLRGLSFKEAVSELADEAGIASSALKSSALDKAKKGHKDFVQANKVAHSFFMEQLRHKTIGLEARRYLIKIRKLTGPMIEQAGLGFGGAEKDDFIAYLRQKGVSTECALAAGLLKQGPFSVIAPFLGRIIFPIRANDGRIIAFGGRLISAASDTPKYVNTHGNTLYEKKKVLYGIFESRAAILKGQTPCLVEGYFDAMAMWAAGIPALALCGTALSAEHARLLKRLSSRLLIAFDQDAAGLKALKAGLSLLFAEQIQPSVIELVRKDPGDYLMDEALHELSTHAANATDALCYAIDHMAVIAHGDIANRIAQIDELMPVIKSISRPLIRRQYVVYLAQKLHEDPSLLWMELEKRTRIKNAEQKKPSRALEQGHQELSAHERLLAPIFLAYPGLVQHAEALGDLVSEPFLAYFLHQKQEGPLERHILRAAEEGVSMTLGEAENLVCGLLEQDKRRKAKAFLTTKRQALQLAEKKKDFTSMLQGLKEHSEILAAQKPKKRGPQPAPQHAGQRKPSEPPKSLPQTEKVIPRESEDEGWY